jgi:hypothetical protein
MEETLSVEQARGPNRVGAQRRPTIVTHKLREMAGRAVFCAPRTAPAFPDGAHGSSRRSLSKAEVTRPTGAVVCVTATMRAEDEDENENENDWAAGEPDRAGGQIKVDQGESRGMERWQGRSFGSGGGDKLSPPRLRARGARTDSD